MGREPIGLGADIQSGMTTKQAIDELQTAQSNGDTEIAHAYADDILCQLLTALGHADVVDEYQKVDKWYA